MNRKEINTIAVLIVIVMILVLLQKKLRINNSVLDFLLICAIIITGRKYLKIAILLTFLLFIIKTNNKKLNEGFVDKLDEDDEEADSDENDDDEADSDEDETKEVNDADETKEEKHEEPETQDIGSLYDDDCRAKCKKSGKSETECKEICSVLCPNPIKYNHDLKELNKLKKIMRELGNQ